MSLIQFYVVIFALHCSVLVLEIKCFVRYLQKKCVLNKSTNNDNDDIKRRNSAVMQKKTYSIGVWELNMFQQSSD